MRPAAAVPGLEKRLAMAVAGSNGLNNIIILMAVKQSIILLFQTKRACRILYVRSNKKIK